MKLSVLPDAQFSCQCCAKCCQGWHVELLAGEKERLDGLKWAADDPLRTAPTSFEHAGKIYLPHEADGACVFLNRTTRLCRIHEQFGEEIKPLGCQLYPFRIVPTFKNEASVTFRYDCPAARRNEGAPVAETLPQLQRFARELELPAPFDPAILNPFKPEQVRATCEFAATLINGFDGNDQRVLFIVFLCDWLGEITPTELDRPMLAAAFTSLKARVATALAQPVKRVGLLHRVAFRTLLGLYLRRDEDILNGHANRFARLLSMCAFVAGFGGFAQMGIAHPKGSLRHAGLFRKTVDTPSIAVSAAHWRMICAKLASFQFMGSANPGHTFLSGLRSLALLFPLVLAAAKYRAGNRGADAIDETDIDFAVGAIEHSFGRGALLQLPFARALEKFLLEPAAVTNLMRTV